MLGLLLVRDTFDWFFGFVWDYKSKSDDGCYRVDGDYCIDLGLVVRLYLKSNFIYLLSFLTIIFCYFCHYFLILIILSIWSIFLLFIGFCFRLLDLFWLNDWFFMIVLYFISIFMNIFVRFYYLTLKLIAVDIKAICVMCVDEAVVNWI